MRAHFDLLCFDLDGTLIDSAPDLSTALGTALRSVNLPAPTEAQTRSWIGDGLENLLRRALEHADCRDEQAFTDALAAFHEHYSRDLFVHSRLYPGVESVLESLRESPSRLCCITNKRTDYAQTMLELAGIDHLLEFTFGGNSFEHKKPHPVQLLQAAGRTGAEPQCSVMIGDSDTDAAAAQAAGFEFVWASFGYCEALKTRDIDTVASARSFTEIPGALASLMP